MRYRRLLAGLHERLAPPTYLEIGINRGGSMALSRAPASIGVDPDYQLEHEVAPDAVLVRETSDDFFAGPSPLGAFGGRPPALALIDGMHLAEYALRDFINVERHTDWWSVIVIDDVVPRKAAHANRERSTRAWTGDVYKLLDILRRRRPDLLLLPVDTEPAGMVVVLTPDPASTVLGAAYEEIAAEIVVPDPQHVPDDLLHRRDLLDPAAVLASSVWDVLREGREAGLDRRAGVGRVRTALRRDLGIGRRSWSAALPFGR